MTAQERAKNIAVGRFWTGQRLLVTPVRIWQLLLAALDSRLPLSAAGGGDFPGLLHAKNRLRSRICFPVVAVADALRRGWERCVRNVEWGVGMGVGAGV